MYLRGGRDVFLKAGDRGPGDRSAKSCSYLSWVPEMHDDLAPRSQVLKRFDEEDEPLARQLKLFQGRFIKNKDDRQ